MSPTAEIAATRPRVRITGRAIVLLALIVGLLVAAAYPVRTYLAQRHDIRSLEQRTQVLARANVKLEHRLRQLQDPAYIERMARECLGMVRAGEIAFVVVPKGGNAEPPPC